MTEAHAEEIGGVIHCYSYTKETAKIFLDMGFYFGIGGVLTFKNAKKLKEAVEYIPMDRIVLETDCPYLAPGTEPRQTQQLSEHSLCDRCHGADQGDHRGRSAQGSMGQFT